MVQEPTNRAQFGLRKRQGAARARRLAHTFVGPDREWLLEYAAELDRQAEKLETMALSISLSLVDEPPPSRSGGVDTEAVDAPNDPVTYPGCHPPPIRRLD